MMSDQKNQDQNDAAEASAQAQPIPASIETKRLSARRRFMRMGAGGTAGLMVTVVHKRAFGAKKTTVQSLCGSLNGTPNFTKAGGGGMTRKTITLSSMGTPKGLVCNSPQNFNTDRNNEGNWWVVSGDTKSSTFNPRVVPDPNDPNKAKFYTFADAEVAGGAADLQSTLNYGNEWRLVEKGWCPIYVDGTGSLQINANVKIVDHYEQRGDSTKWQSCKL